MSGIAPITIRNVAIAGAVVLAAACAQKVAPPPPPPPPQVERIPARPIPPGGASYTMAIPPLGIDGQRLTQSLAILEYLDATRQMGLLPGDPVARAKAQALAMVIAVDLHPICNLSVASHATGGEEPARTDWMRHFIGKGLTAFEEMLGAYVQEPFCTGTAPGLADVCLIPQLYNADRWGAPLEAMPRIRAVREACDALPAFAEAHPDRC